MPSVIEQFTADYCKKASISLWKADSFREISIEIKDCIFYASPLLFREVNSGRQLAIDVPTCDKLL